jgi:hypothetical protein
MEVTLTALRLAEVAILHPLLTILNYVMHNFFNYCWQLMFHLSILPLRDLERGPLSLVRIIEELLEWKSSGFGLENRE